MANTAVSGYPDIFGKHAAWVGDHTGPASYSTGGETIGVANAPGSFGLRSIDFVGVEGISYSGNYFAEVVSPIGSGGSAQTRKLRWFNNPPAMSSPLATPLTLGTLSGAATQSVYTANGVCTVSTATPPPLNSFVLLTNGATAFGIFLDGVIVQVTAVVAGTSFSFNFGAAKALFYSLGADTLKYQVLYGGASTNPVALGTGPGQSIAVTAVAVASNVLTITCANTALGISAGNFIVLQGLAAGEVPQGAIVQVLTANTTTITANLIAPNLSVTSGETGTATVLVTNGNAPIQASQYVSTINGSTIAATARSASAAGVITVLPVVQTLAAGNLVVIQGLTHGSTLNGLISAVLAAGLTSTNVEMNGNIAAAVTTGTGDVGALGLLATGVPIGDGEVAAGTNLSGETVRLMLVGG
jgi:hypothetical protein